MIAITVYSLLGGLVFAMNGKLLHKKISLASWIAYFIGGAFVTLGFYNIVGDPFTRFPQLQELIPDFITQWVGAACLFGFDTMVLMCVYFFVHTIRRTIIMYRDAAGMWVDNRWQPIVSAIVNLTLNIVLIHLIGINGIVISTIISMVLVDIPWETKALINRLFRESVVRYCLVVLYFALITVAGCLITWLLLRRIPAESLLVRLALECGASVLIGAGVFLGLTVFMPEQKWMISRLKGAIVHKQS